MRLPAAVRTGSWKSGEVKWSLNEKWHCYCNAMCYGGMMVVGNDGVGRRGVDGRDYEEPEVAEAMRGE